MWKSKFRLLERIQASKRYQTFFGSPSTFFKADEEKKVEAVRDFYEKASENKKAADSAERLLLFGGFQKIASKTSFDLSSDGGSFLYSRLQCYILVVWTNNVHGRQLTRQRNKIK